MATDRIDQLIDLPQIERQVSYTEDRVNDLLKLIEQVNKTGISLQGNKNFSESAKLRKELADLVKQTELSAKAAIAEEKARLSAAKAMEAEAKAAEAASKAKLVDVKVTTELTKQQIIQTKETERQAKAKEKEAAASAKAAQKAQEEQRPYKQLALAFAAAAKEAQDLAAQYGTMDKRAQAAAKTANGLNNQLKAIDSSIGNHQRNVGNYGSAFDKVGVSVKNLATNFLGLVGIVSVGSLFSSSIDEFVEMEKNVRQLQNTLKNLGVPEAFDRISASADKLQKQFGYLDNDDVLKTFNQLIVYGKLTEKQMNELVPVIIDFAAASGQDLASATSLIIKSLEGNGKALKEYGINMKDAGSTAEAFGIIMTELKPKVDGVAKSFADSESGGLAKAKQDFKDLKEEIGTGLLPIINELLRTLLKVPTRLKTFGKAVKESFSGGTGFFAIAHDDIVQQSRFQAETAELIDQRVSSYNSLTKTLVDQKATKEQIAKSQTAVTQKLLDDIKKANSDLDYLKKNTRFNNAEDYAAIYKALQTIEVNEAALAQIRAKVSDQVLGTGDPNDPFKSNTKKDDAAKKAEELAERIRKANFEAAKAAQLENIKLQEEIFKDESKSFDERITALREYVQEKARLIELERTFEKGAKGLTKEEIVAIETQKQTELNQLVRDGHQEYNKILEQQQKEEQRLHKENADRIKAIHDKLQKDIEAGLKEANDRLKEQIAEREAIEREAANLRAELANESIGLAFDLLTAQYEKEKNLIQDQIDLLERKKQKDIEVANATITNAQDRANAISIINDRAAAEEAILEQKKRQINVKEAQFEKAASIASIIANTAEAIVKALDKPVLIPLIAAIGAAQLARVVATPIPKYKHGTESHKGGLAIVGDGGKSEGIRLPDGTLMKTAATSQVVDLPKGSKVYPDFDKMMMQVTMTRPVVYKQSTRSDRTSEVVSGLNKVEKAIRRIPQASIQVDNIISKRIRSGNSFNTYLTRNIT